MVTGFINGILAYVQAFRLISKLRLWGYILIPGLISLLLGSIIGASVWNFSDTIGNFLVNLYPFDWGQKAVAMMGSVLGGIIVAGSGLLVYKHAVLVLSAPFMSPLSEKVEQHLLGGTHTIQFSVSQMISDLIRGSKIAIRNITREIFYLLVLLLFGLIPFLSPFTAILIILVQAFYAGFGNIDYTLERHYNVRSSIRFVRRNRGLALGNGLVFVGLLALGIGFLIAPPLGTVAATIETTKRLDR